MSDQTSPLGMSHKAAAEARLGSLVSAAAVMSARRLTAQQLADYVQQGHIVEVNLPDGTGPWYPSGQFSRRRDPRVVAIAAAAFRDVDPSGVTAASWLMSVVSPDGWRWRDLDHFVTQDGGMQIVSAIACLDALRLRGT